MLRHGTCSCNIQHEPGVLEFDTAATAISRKPTHKDLSLVNVLLQFSTQWDFSSRLMRCQSMVNVKHFCNIPLAWSLRKDASHKRKRAERSGETLVGKTARKTLRKPAAARVSPVKKNHKGRHLIFKLRKVNGQVNTKSYAVITLPPKVACKGSSAGADYFWK